MVPVSQTLMRYLKLSVESKASVLAMKLARESFFGESILCRCTVMGIGKYPTLPTDELNELKQTLFSQFPKYWSSPVEFESLWRECAEAIGKGLRLQAQKKSPVVIV